MNPHPSGWATSLLSAEWNPLFLSEDYMCAVGLPIEVSRKGKAPPLERGKGKYSPPANPIGSLRKP